MSIDTVGAITKQHPKQLQSFGVKDDWIVVHRFQNKIRKTNMVAQILGWE